MFRRLTLTLALGLVVAAVIAPAALAKPVSADTLNGGYDPVVYSLVYQSTHPLTAQETGPLDPWAYSLVHKSPATPVVTTSSGSGFDYADAGIGAAVSLGVALILLGTVVVGLRHRRTLAMS